MASKTQMVTIPLEEYKELLLKERPDDKRAELFERMMTMVEKRVEYDEDANEWSSGYIMDKLMAKRCNDLVKDFVTMLRYVDFERYMDLWNKCATDARNREAMEARIEQMNAAKEIRKEAANG